MARTGLRMMVGWNDGADRASNDADVSIVPPKIPDGGFSPVRLQGRPFGRGLPSTAQEIAVPGLPPPFVPLARLVVSPLCVGGQGCLEAPPFEPPWPLYPRGPRSGPGYSVPIHPHLFDPIRPTGRPIRTSPSCGLYPISSLCIAVPPMRRLGDPPLVPCFPWLSFIGMPSSETTGSSSLAFTQFLPR